MQSSENIPPISVGGLAANIIFLSLARAKARARGDIRVLQEDATNSVYGPAYLMNSPGDIAIVQLASIDSANPAQQEIVAKYQELPGLVC